MIKSLRLAVLILITSSTTVVDSTYKSASALTSKSTQVVTHESHNDAFQRLRGTSKVDYSYDSEQEQEDVDTEEEQRMLYNPYGNNTYYGDDATDDDDANVDDTGDTNENEDNNQDIDGSGNSTGYQPSEWEEQFWEWYDSPPAEWTNIEWAWVSGAVSIGIAFLFCCCMGCVKVTQDTHDRACGDKYNAEKYYNFDDYTSVDDSTKGSKSWVTLNTKNKNGQDGDTDDDGTINDDATYDSIMRMRSK
mmetsp:Transcript_15127/g.18433  ORF Transcript_15127/g.18433 Transcript_15127/m.18433 type:complete len:248 (+) Transcript_15127:291-1034(+)